MTNLAVIGHCNAGNFWQGNFKNSFFLKILRKTKINFETHISFCMFMLDSHILIWRKSHHAGCADFHFPNKFFVLFSNNVVRKKVDALYDRAVPSYVVKINFFSIFSFISIPFWREKKDICKRFQKVETNNKFGILTCTY